VSFTQPPQPSYEELAALVVELRLLASAQVATIAEKLCHIPLSQVTEA
jgi:hypothetical protein